MRLQLIRAKMNSFTLVTEIIVLCTARVRWALHTRDYAIPIFEIAFRLLRCAVDRRAIDSFCEQSYLHEDDSVVVWMAPLHVIVNMHARTKFMLIILLLCVIPLRFLVVLLNSAYIF